MKVKEAYELLIANTPKLRPIQCFEYDTLFVFQIVPKSFNEKTDNADQLIDCLRSVNKATKEVRDFKPFHISLNEYRNGKEVKDFV